MANNVDQVTLSQAARILKKKYHQVHRMLRKDRFKSAVKVGWGWLIDRDEVNQLRKPSRSN
jgi:hypothetical protein